MPVTTAIAIFFLIWWVVLFAVLPFGVRSQHEDGEIAPGTDPGAPAIPELGRKLFWTTLVSVVIFAAATWSTSTTGDAEGLLAIGRFGMRWDGQETFVNQTQAGSQKNSRAKALPGNPNLILKSALRYRDFLAFERGGSVEPAPLDHPPETWTAFPNA